MSSPPIGYAELQATSNFSFLRGASHPAELVLRAKELGLDAIAVTDRNTLAGIVRAHSAARQVGMRLVVGARLDFTDAPSVLAFPTDRDAYGRLAQLLTHGKRRAEKGACRLSSADLVACGDGMKLAAIPPERLDAAFLPWLRSLRQRFRRNVYTAATRLHHADDARRIETLAAIAREARAPLVATNDVHAHVPERRPVQDVLTCIREGCRVDTAGYRLNGNAERHLKPGAEMARLFPGRPELLARTLEIVAACRFSLDELRYEYPDEPVPPGRTAQEELERLAWSHAARRYAGAVPEKIRALLEKELAVIARLDFARYFLTVHDIVRFAREQGILCQGRGSAANSALCFVLGITAVDPERIETLFERFISVERGEPPDIDLDFEHERREEVIQYIYGKYGRERAGIVATVVTYRPKSAIRDVGKAFGLSADSIAALSGLVPGWGREGLPRDGIKEAGLDPADARLLSVLAMARAITGFPRHLSQHTGGFVVTRGRLSEIVPIENASMPGRTVIEWDKDDLDDLNMLKIDILGLGMLTCLRKGLALVERHYGVRRELNEIPRDDPAVFDMLCHGNSVGIFQVESRAQMAMLPRLKPRCFYDLVVQVAIVRPGPIQGDMVHPYLRRREGKEPADLPSEELRGVLGHTCGVPLFQEQAMRIAIVAAGFSPQEANELRRAMATFRHVGTIGALGARFVEGMVRRGYEKSFAEACFRQIEGFGEYGFPESHAASFALLVYVSAWLKCHYPAAFACAILNSQPMGFYAPAQLVRDAVENGVALRPVDAGHSEWDNTLEPDGKGGCALRLGLRQIKGCRRSDADRLSAARRTRPGSYRRQLDLWMAAGLGRPAVERLAAADAHGSFGVGRRGALWQSRMMEQRRLPLFSRDDATEDARARDLLPEADLPEEVGADYASLGLSLKAHPLRLLRQNLAAMGIERNRRLAGLADGRRVKVAGLALIRQQPDTASGVIFATIEDETGTANIIVWPGVFQRYRRAFLSSRLMVVEGRVQVDASGRVIHVVAERIADHSSLLAPLFGGSNASKAPRAIPTARDFR
ncbi:MAG: error-prone DNA polymerase [Alphaproteobacteria bacterium]|nr:error-prone DNA polymerase [Alphaproteobacteria bacterium]